MRGRSTSSDKILGMKSPVAGQEAVLKTKKSLLRMISLFCWPMVAPVLYALFTLGANIAHNPSLSVASRFVDALLAAPLFAMLQLVNIHLSNLAGQLAAVGVANYLSGLVATLFVRFLLRQINCWPRTDN